MWSGQRKKVAIVATARKMLSVMRAMLITGEVFNEKLILQQEQIKRTKEQQERIRKEFYN